MPKNLKRAIERVRAELPVVQKKLYFNTGWTGPSPKRVLEEERQVLEWLSAEGVSHHNYTILNADLDRLRSRLASLLGAGADEIVVTRSTTEAINIVINGIDWQRGDRLVTTNVEHGAGLVPAYVLRDRYGVSVEIVDLSDGRNILRKLGRAIDSRTRLVSVSHVSFNTGLRLPLKELAALTTERGAELLVDGAQAVGVFAIDLHDTGCDYYSFPGHKWLFGPDATGALYVRKDRIPGLAISFAGNESADTFDREGNVTYRDDAGKFQMCDLNGALISGWIKALDFLEEFGMENIETAIRRNATYLKGKLADMPGVRLVSPRQWKRSAGLVSIKIEGRPAEKAFETLLKKGIVVRYTPPPSFLRISVNYFNTRKELDQLLDAIRGISRA